MKRMVGVAVVGLALVLPGVVAAHPTRVFDSCSYNTYTNRCVDNNTYLYGDTVYMRATVKPAHASQEANLLQQNPRSHNWRTVGRHIPISDAGKMRWSWDTTIDDANQNHPYHFRFRIPGHGTSDVTEVWIIFGE
jgi:hypothetical protein